MGINDSKWRKEKMKLLKIYACEIAITAFFIGLLIGSVFL